MDIEKRFDQIFNGNGTSQDLVSEENKTLIQEAQASDKLKDVMYDFWTSVGRQALGKLKGSNLDVEKRPSQNKSSFSFDIRTGEGQQDMLVQFYFDIKQNNFVFNVKYQGDVPLGKTAPIKEYDIKDTMNVTVEGAADKHARIIQMNVQSNQ